MLWLLEASVRLMIEQAYKFGTLPTAQQQMDYEARYAASASETNSRLLTVAGNNAEVSVKGVLTKAPSFLAMIFGGGNTTYGEIISALAEAEADDTVDNITLAVDSPGGQFDGLFDAIAYIQGTSKPVKAVISGVAASAAFALASQADEVIASNRAARIGSVGVAATIGVDDREVTITSTEAPRKRPDVTTEEGRAMVREELDAMHEIFVEAIADGRSTTVEKVNAEFGRGATLLAGEALKRGMIDAVAGPPLKVVGRTKTTTARSGGNQPEAGNMDLKELETQHPDVYTAAVQLGTDQERDRVTAHLTMGESSGDNKTAYAAIKDGSGMTATLQATYMTAGMNRRDVADRQDDDDSSTAGDNAGESKELGGSADAVASLVEAKLGLEA